MSVVDGHPCSKADLARWDAQVTKGEFPSREIARAAELHQKNQEARAAKREAIRAKRKTRRKTARSKAPAKQGTPKEEA